MPSQDLNELKSYLVDYVNSITRRKKGALYECPLCGSGTGTHKTPAFSIAKDGQHWKCFACGKGGDIYDLCSEYEHIEPSEATKSVIAKYGNAGSSVRREARMEKKKIESAEAVPAMNTDYTEDVAKFVEALKGSSKAIAYLRGRGFTDETISRYRLGYNPQNQTITIPYNRQCTYYGQRKIYQSKYPHDNLKGVPVPLFNEEALQASDVVFVVESPLCAISIMQEGGTAVALSGVPAGISRLIKYLQNNTVKADLALCLDNDDAGRNATKELDAALTQMGKEPFECTAAIMGEERNSELESYRKDPNEVLQRSGANALREAIADTVANIRSYRASQLQKAEIERAERTGAGMVDSFLAAIQTHKYEPIPTGIKDIDRALCGGFTRQQLIVLGAAPGAGKTALAQWVFEGMAAHGTSCVYVNLEMSRDQLLARSLSRMAARQGKRVRPLEILQGYKWTHEQREAITAAAEEYKNTIAPRFVMNPEGINTDLDVILEYIETEAKRAEDARQTAPAIVLDYLQLITGQPREDATAVIKRAVAGLKGYAIKHNTIVFVIIAHNRQSNASGNVSMEAARDTSAIEYSADIQLALTFTGCLKRNGQKGKTPDDLTAEERRNITLRIIKGRFGGAGKDVDLYFEGETMTYKQLATDFVPTNEPTPFDGQMSFCKEI